MFLVLASLIEAQVKKWFPYKKNVYLLKVIKRRSKARQKNVLF